MPDVPVVTWWPTTMPACAAEDPLGRMSTRERRLRSMKVA
nr:glucose-6-phosphate dehydrogenase assembly protein OpcA [Actinomyces sp. 217892]